MDTKVQHMLLRYGERNMGWGNLHVVLEDGNLEDENIKYCLQSALDDLDGDGAVIANWLLKLSEEERSRVYGNIWSKS